MDSNDKVPIRGDLPLSIHPENIVKTTVTALNNDVVGNAVLQTTREALTAASRSYGLFVDTYKAIFDEAPNVTTVLKGGNKSIDKMISPTRMREFAKAAEAEYAKITLTMERKLKELESHGTLLAKQFAKALYYPEGKTAPGIAVASDIRRHVASLKDDAARLSFLMKAAKASDMRTLSAVLSAPAYLSGVTDELLATVKQVAAPAAYAAIEAANRCFAQVELAKNNLIDLHAKAAKRMNPASKNANKALELLAGAKFTPEEAA